MYEENGLDHTKALLSALGDRGKELGLDILGGFLSGPFLSGGKSGYNAIQFNRMGQEALDTGSYRDYISLGLLADHDSEAYRYAEEIRAKLNAGREVTNIEMGQLTAAVYADALGVGEKRSEEAREEPDEDIWDRVFDGEEDDDLQRELAEELGLDEPTGQEALTDEAPENTIGAEFAILRSLGAKAKNYMVLDPASNKKYPFVEGTRIKDPIVFAGKGTSKELHKEVAQGLSEKIGGKPSEWQHCKGIGILNVDGKDMEAEVHWFQEPSVGKHRFKVKKWLDD